MTLLQSLKNLVTFTAPEFSAPLSVKAAPATVDLFGPMGQRNADWSSVQTSEKVRGVFRMCATAYACATLLADAVAESPLRVYRTVDGELEEQPGHRARILIANPNPVMSEAEFISLIVMTQALFGYGLVEKVRSAARIPVELWPIRPDWLKTERANDGRTLYVLRVPGLDPRV